MSTETIKQRADAEADAVEHEAAEAAAAEGAEQPDEPDEPEPDEPEPELEPVKAARPLTEKEVAALSKKIDAAGKTHENALRRILGEDFESWMPCPLCMTDGHFQPMPLEERDPAQVEAVEAALGRSSAPDLKPLQGVEQCPDCGGWGVVATPSKRADNATVNCMSCQTRGYREVIAPAPEWRPPPPPGYDPANGQPAAWTPPPPPGYPPATPAGYPPQPPYTP